MQEPNCFNHWSVRGFKEDSRFRRDKTPTVYMMVGVCGSGKSTCAQDIVKKVAFYPVYISSDDIREELFPGEEYNPKHNGVVFKTFYSRARKALEEGHDVILDATNVTKWERNNAKKQLKGIDCHWTAVVMDTPYDIAVSRNMNRDRTVPQDAMDKMQSRYQDIDDDENFNLIWRIRNG